MAMMQRGTEMIGKEYEGVNNLEISKRLFINGGSRDGLLQGEAEERAQRAPEG